MLVKVENTLSGEVSTAEFAVGTFDDLQHHLECSAKLLNLPLRVLSQPGARGIEVRSAEGLLLARYTPNEN